MKIILTLLTIIVFSGPSFAKDATRITPDINLIPSTDTNSARALKRAELAEENSELAFDEALSANEKAQGTIDSLVAPDGCVYNDTFDCTEENLTHQYKVKTWNAGGTYYWIPPSDIRELYIVVKGTRANFSDCYVVQSDGSSGGSNNICTYYTGENSTVSSSSFNAVTALKGSSGNYYKCGRWYTSGRDGDGYYTTVDCDTVPLGETIIKRITSNNPISPLTISIGEYSSLSSTHSFIGSVSIQY